MTLTGIVTPLHPGLSVRDLTVRIPTRRDRVVHAATGVTLDAPRGRVTVLTGESGCGKSVIAGAVMSLLPRNAEVTGSVMVWNDGRSIDVLRDPPAHRGRTVALVSQSPATHFTPGRTIRSQLEEAIRAVRSAHTTHELAARAGLPFDALDCYPHELSGGMAQRAAVAAALSGEPAVLIADEPTASLDRRSTDRMLALVREVADTGVAVLVITHDLASLLRTGVADSLAVMYASRIMESGPACDVLNDPLHPYTRELLAALPERGFRVMSTSPPELTDVGPHCPYTGGPSALVVRGERIVREAAL